MAATALACLGASVLGLVLAALLASFSAEMLAMVRPENSFKDQPAGGEENSVETQGLYIKK